MKNKLSSSKLQMNGTITLPKLVQNFLGVRKGKDSVDFFIKNNYIIIKKSENGD